VDDRDPDRRAVAEERRMQRTRARTALTATGMRLGATVAALVAVSVGTTVAVATPAQAATAVKISRIYCNSPGTDNRSNTSLNAEYVTLQNLTTRTQMITGWTIRDAAGHVYTFPTTSIPAGRTVTLHTGKGTNTSASRYWQQSKGPRIRNCTAASALPGAPPCNPIARVPGDCSAPPTEKDR
jgi:Lamin Tail Domain